MTDQTAERVSGQTIASPTKPGWRPAGKLAHLKARPGFTARWVSADTFEVSKKKSEGWIVMKPEDHIGADLGMTDVNDGGSPANQIRYRELIAMMLPDSIKKEREEYYKRENREAQAHLMKKSDAELKKHGATPYKPKGMEGRIVIE